MKEQILDIPTKDGAMETFVCHPERGGPYPPVLFLMGASLVYYVLMPVAWKFFASFQGMAAEGLPVELLPRVSEYLGLVMRLIFMPFRAARWQGVGGPYAHPAHAWISMWNGLAWFAVMIFGIWAVFHYVPEFRDFIRTFQTSWTDSGFHV